MAANVCFEKMKMQSGRPICYLLKSREILVWYEMKRKMGMKGNWFWTHFKEASSFSHEIFWLFTAGLVQIWIHERYGLHSLHTCNWRVHCMLAFSLAKWKEGKGISLVKLIISPLLIWLIDDDDFVSATEGSSCQQRVIIWRTTFPRSK